MLMVKNKKSNQQKFVTRKFFVIYNLALLPVLFTGLAILGIFVRNQFELARNDTTQIQMVIRSAVEGLSSPAPLTDQNTVQYIPEERLRFSRSTNTDTHIQYSYFEGYEDEPAHISITSETVKNASSSQMSGYTGFEKLFNYIPQYQQCQRLYVLSFTDQAPSEYDSLEIVSTYTVGNRQLYIWKNTQPLCPAATNSETAMSDLLTTLQTVTAY